MIGTTEININALINKENHQYEAGNTTKGFILINLKSSD